jgi:hypothetical protein
MGTSRRSPSRTRRPPTLEILAQALMAVGFVLMTLGILEIGGLFNVGVGFATIWLGCVLLFLRGGGGRGEDEELARMRDDR